MSSEFAIGVASDMAIMSLLALSAYLMLLVGRISFGQQAFFGIGAYASGLASAVAQWPLAAALVVGMAAGALCSWLVAWPTLRLSGLHYAVASLAFGEMVRLALKGWVFRIETPEGAVGPNGLEGFRDIRWLLENDVSAGAYLGLVAVVLLVVLALLGWAERNRVGVAWRMAGHDDVLAAAQGVPVMRLRLVAAALAGALAALGGGLYAHRTTYIEPALFDPMLGVHAVGYALIGGLGTALGPLLGVAFDLGLLEATRIFAGWRMVVFGGLVALFLRWRPRGLLDEALVHAIAERWRARRGRPGRGARVARTAAWFAAALGLGALLAGVPAQTFAQPAPRAVLQLQCESFGIGPQLDCLINLQASGAPLKDARVTLGAHMPSMPMAHSVKPVQAVATAQPGAYRATLELEMTGVWALQVDVAGPLRDRVSRSLRIEDCPDGKRCPVAPASTAASAPKPRS